MLQQRVWYLDTQVHITNMQSYLYSIVIWLLLTCLYAFFNRLDVDMCVFDITKPWLSSSLYSICPWCIAEKHRQVVMRFSLVLCDYFSRPGSSCCINLLKTFFVWFVILGCRMWEVWRNMGKWCDRQIIHDHPCLNEKDFKIFSILECWKFGRLLHYINLKILIDSLMDIFGTVSFPAWMAGCGCWGFNRYPRCLSQHALWTIGLLCFWWVPFLIARAGHILHQPCHQYLFEAVIEELLKGCSLASDANVRS